ncbi:MAG TPA: carboxylesterase family protein [Gammaproteobacteria bacterium]|nr:carboxylesterase family protein [Gammaproteobacteria bacterium]
MSQQRAGRAGVSLALAAALGALFSLSANAALKEPLKLDSGEIGGSVESAPGIHAFKGIPFAAPPVGALRWTAPQPVPKWSGVRDASKFGNVCIQPPGQGRLNIANMAGSPPTSEDCLYLNVWTGAASAGEKRPVMIWWFGGAFTEGGGAVPLYDGTALAKKGVVVVTMNYRLGAFGFFAHPALTAESPHKASGNYGLMDMLASARWVKNNIAAFGGDPDNVTVFGQSAGAMAIASLVASPEAKGLFKRAISESGAWMGLGMAPGMPTRAQLEERNVKVASDAGASTAVELRALSAADVAAKLRSGGCPGCMIVDGWVIPEDPSATYAAGRQNAVDVLVGSNKEELSFGRGATAEQFEAGARMRYGDLADEFLKLYPHATDEEAARSNITSTADGTYWHMRLYADYQAKKGRKAYLFFFAQNPPAPEGKPPFPAAHAAEVPYVFDNLGQAHLFPDSSIAELSAKSAPDKKVADEMSSYWTNFAKTGDPNGPGLPKWKVHAVGNGQDGMILDANPASEKLPTPERLAFIDRVWVKQGHTLP